MSIAKRSEIRRPKTLYQQSFKMDNTTSNSVAGTLHPLIPTTEPRPGDTSMDTSVDHMCHGFDEDMATERIYGVGC